MSRRIVSGTALILLLGSILSLRLHPVEGQSLSLEMRVNKTITTVGENIAFSLTLTNMGESNVKVTYTPPLFDVLYCTNEGCFRWSDGMYFAQVVLSFTLEPGQNRTETILWNLYQYRNEEFYPPKQGEYDLLGMCLPLRLFTRTLTTVTIIDADMIVPNDYSTIQAAINAASHGGEIYVRSGMYYENVVANKTASLIGEDSHTTIIRSLEGPEDFVVRISADNTTMKEFTVLGKGRSILVLRNPTAADNMVEGIKIQDVTVVGGYTGVQLHHCKNSIICSSTFLNNTYAGIDLLFSGENNIIGNRISGVYWEGINLMTFSNSNRITQNIIEFNTHDGISFGQSFENLIEGNTILNHGRYGIRVSSSGENKIFHNNFINNTNQVHLYDSLFNSWNDGRRGNYWSDYNGSDAYSGPFQNLTGSDGIGDVPYIIDENNTDNYPLMNLYWNPSDITHDFKVDMKDMGCAARAFGTEPGDERWNPHADITGPVNLQPDSMVTMRDIGLIARSFGEEYL